MDACIFVLTINSLLPVYGMDKTTQVDSVHTNDKVCVMAMESGDWMKVHWSNGTIGHAGYLQGVDVHQMGQPTAPEPHEEEYAIAPQAPPPPPPPQDTTPRQQRGYQQPNLDSPVMRPAALVMQCHPQQSAPYAVVYMNGNAAVIGGRTGHTTEYQVLGESDNQHSHIFYVRAKRQDQERTLYFAFDYSQRGSDVSAIRVMAPNGYDAKDKCFMDWDDTK